MSEGLTLLYVKNSRGASGFVIAGVVHYTDAERPGAGGYYAIAELGSECPLADITVLGHLPISIKGLER